MGRFRIVAPDNSELTLKSKKAQAILAILAMSPDHERSKQFLQDTLWSRQDSEQSYGSLRQAIRAIRKAFGAHKDLIEVRSGLVRLKGEQLRIAPTHALANTDERVFLEGLDLAEPEFLEWRNQKRGVSQSGDGSLHPVPTPKGKPKLPRNVRIFSITPSGLSNSLTDFSAMLGDQVTQLVAEQGSVSVIANESSQKRDYVRSDLVLHTKMLSTNDKSAIRIRLESGFNGNTLWSGVRTVQSDAIEASSRTEIHKLLNMAVDSTLAEFANMPSAQDSEMFPAVRSFQAVRTMFGLGEKNLATADAMLEQAFEHDPQGIYLGWRAYLRIIFLGERMKKDPDATREEAQAFIRRAMERTPHNSMVLALASYVQCILFRNYSAAFSLAQSSLDVCAHNPLAWAFQGISRMHLGEVDLAYKNTQYAREISGPGPHKYQLDMLACQTASVVGRFDEAIQLGQMVRAAAPDYAPPLRYLSALYLATNRGEDADATIAQLQRLEPGFSIDLMLDAAYPVAALRKSKLIETLSDIRLQTS